MALAPFTGAKRLRELLKDPKHMVVLPGVFDGFTARIAGSMGFEGIYMTGAGTSISRMGWADLGIATLSDMRGTAEMIASLNPSLPVIADADTGYGGPIMVSRTVTQYARAGVAALHIEDQAQEKRCGHLQGKVIVDRDIYYTRVSAAVHARDQLQSDMLIIARTDARQTYGFDEAVARLKAAVDIGVDVVFFEAMVSVEEARKVCEIFKGTPVLFNMVAGGATPPISVAEAQEIGFRIVIVPGICFGPVLKACSEELQYLKDRGTLSKVNTTGGVKDAFNLAGLQECIALDQAAGGKAFDTVGK